MSKIKKIFKKIFFLLAGFIIAGIAIAVVTNLYVMIITSGKILTEEEAEDKNVDCIIVLGAGVKSDGSPSPMLRDRLDKAAELYEMGVSNRIIVSGDHRSRYYDEVNTMKNYLIGKGIPSECIFMDHAGLSTYDSMYRAVNVFGVKSAVVVTQKYHMYRALYDARAMGIEAYGVTTVEADYSGQAYRDIREVAARIKDVGYCIIKPPSEVIGESVSLDESGDVTND